MPIKALPQTTVRAIGSTSVISDPCSIVKELLDNSLDAHATAISVEISQNTVDVIQVKDNGRGIPAEDHPFVCRRAFTSKIATVEDLRKLGGKSLGFRGEALASAAEVCGGVTVTTRVEADPVGFCIKYGRNGELIRYVTRWEASELRMLTIGVLNVPRTQSVQRCELRISSRAYQSAGKQY